MMVNNFKKNCNFEDMKRIIFLLLFVGGSIFANAQPFTNIQANQSGLSVRTNLNNMINYINALGLKIEYSTDGVTWNYPWQNGNIYTRFSGDYGTNWTPKMFMWDGSVLGSIEADTLKIGTDVITGFSSFLTFADTTTHLATKYNLSQLGISGGGIIYDISAETATGGANLRLSGTDNSTDDVKFAGSGATTVSRTDANTITISSTDNNTTYSAGTGLSLAGTTFNHSNAVTAGSFGPGSNATLTWGGTFTVPSGAYDAQGHLTGATNRTMTMPANPNTTYAISAETVSGGANLRLTGSDSSTDNVKVASGWGVDVTRTDANTITLKADTTRLATQYDLTQISGGGGSPAGSGSEIQYRAGASTFGALTGSTVTGANLGLSGKLNVTYNSSVDWGTVVTNTNSSGLGLAVLSGSHLGGSTIFTANTYTGYPRFEVSASGTIFMPALTNASTANVLYYNISTGALTYGAATAGTSPLTTKGDIYTRSSSADTRLPVGTNGQILSANSATATGLQWINAPSGSSIWTDAGTYAHLNGYEEIYMPFTKSISWRTTSGDVSGNNLFKIVCGMAALEFKGGSSDVLAMSLYNNNQAYLSNLAVRGSLSISNGPNSAYEDDAYSIATFSANNNAKFGFLGGGTIAMVARSTTPTNPASGWGYWYTKTDGKPYFKNSSGTEYDLSASGSGTTTFLGLTDTPSSYTGQGGKFIRVNTGATALEFADSPGGGMTNPMTTVGDIIYASASGSPATPARLSGNSTTGKMFLSQSGNGVTPSAPSWSTVTKSDVGLANVENTALSTWTGSSSVTTLGTITSGTWNGSTIAANRGGTGQTTYAIGDILYASSTTALSRLAASTSGYVLTTKGAGAAPAWEPLAGGGMVYPSTGIPYSTGSSWGTSYSISGTGTVLALTNSPTFTTPTISATASGTTAGRLGYSSGDLSFGTGSVQRVIVSTDATQTLTNKTISGLNNTLTVRLANDVTGTLPVSNGGTGITSYAVGDLLYASGTGTLNKLSPGTAGYILETQGAGLAPRWIAPPTGGGLSAHALDYHSDVQYVMPIDVGQVLYHTGTEWTNDSPNNAGLVDKTTNQTISGTKTFSTNFIIPSTELSTPTKFTAITSTNAVGPISKSSALTMLGGSGGSTANFLRGDGTWAEVFGYLEIVVETETDFINAFTTATSQTKPVRIYVNSNQIISSTPGPITFTANRQFINDGTRQVEIIGVKSLYVVGSSGALAHFNTQANIVAFKNVIFRNMLFYSTGESYLWTRGSGNLKFYECQFTNQPLSTETERNAVTFSDTDGDLTVPNGTGVSNNTCTIEFDGLTILNASSVNNNYIMTRLSPFIIRNKTADVGSGGNFYVTIKRMNPVQEKSKFAVVKLTSDVTANSGTRYKVAADDSWYYHSTQSAPGTGNIRGSSIFGYNYVHQVSGTSIDKQFSAGEATVLTLSANTTLGINEVFDGAVGTILVEQNSVGNYNLGLTFFPQDVLSTPLTQVIIGSISDINKTANKHSLITFKRYGSKVTIVYGHQP